MHNPTPEQQSIIDDTGNRVVLARPGSGKTFVLSRIIQPLLENLPFYKGVIAISYTNKASRELKERCLVKGLSAKESFFGTIDSFCVREIIIPFGKLLWGNSVNEFDVVSLRDNPELRNDVISQLGEYDEYDIIEDELSVIHLFKQHFSEGRIILDFTGLLALYIFHHSLSCRKYLTARYSHQIIDEYQDTGYEQHRLFKAIANLGIISIAVGDSDQSIFQFSKKDPKYLLSLTNVNSGFTLYTLTINHRCHPSIINYSTRLLNPSAPILPYEDSVRVCSKHVIGDEGNIAFWIDSQIEYLCDRLSINKKSDIGILVRGNITGDRINETLAHPHNLAQSTDLDSHFSLWSQLFCQILRCVFDPTENKYQLIEDVFSTEIPKPLLREMISTLGRIEDDIKGGRTANVDDFILIASIVYPSGRNSNSIDMLVQTISSSEKLNDYTPPKENEIQIMTLHKSKGLEFDVVFHLDLIDGQLPYQHWQASSPSAKDIAEGRNLHYVGITRARKACFLVSTSQSRKFNRRNGSYFTVSATPSFFLRDSNLQPLRTVM